eukprot:UN20512
MRTVMMRLAHCKYMIIIILLAAPMFNSRGSDNPMGMDADSCGDIGQGLIPVDCTEGGDSAATCVFSNHCFCQTDGYVCDDSGLQEECTHQSTMSPICIPLGEFGCGLIEDSETLVVDVREQNEWDVGHR